MSLKQIAHNNDTKRLLDEGYEVEIRGGYLLVHSIPFVTSKRSIARGLIITNLNINASEIGKISDHQVWFAGEFPCHSSGKPIESIRHSSQVQTLVDNIEVQHRFSNKPQGGYLDYYSKITTYVNIIVNEAKAVDPSVTPCTYNIIPPVNEASVFKYHDSASSRADILTLSQKLAMERIDIIGLGGTGSYILDMLAKTPVIKIHLHDGDLFFQHNAFRSPGAASLEELSEKKLKVDYFAEKYSNMRHGIIPHGEYITDDNISVLSKSKFVFLCVDNGYTRKLMSDYLITHQIPFIDVGMELMHEPIANALFGTCRATMSTPDKSNHFSLHVPLNSNDGEDLYRKNIQVADMNMFNAAIAVIKWKQYCAYYVDHFNVLHTTYSIDSHSLTRDIMAKGSES